MLKVSCLDERGVAGLLGDEGAMLHQHTMRLLQRCAYNVGNSQQRLAYGIAVHREYLKSNRDGRHTAFTTSFTLANNYWMAPVAQSAMHSVEDLLQKQHCTKWLQYINGCAGEFGGLLLRRMLAPPFIEWLEWRIELTNPPCPGLAVTKNVFLTSVQVNCSNNKVQLAGTAGDTHRNGKDDGLSYLVAVHASVLRAGADQSLILFLSLRYAVRLRPGLVLVFQGIEPHWVMPLVLLLDPTELLAPGYNADTLMVAILYPKQFILSGTRPKTLPEDARPLGQVP